MSFSKTNNILNKKMNKWNANYEAVKRLHFLLNVKMTCMIDIGLPCLPSLHSAHVSRDERDMRLVHQYVDSTRMSS